MTSQPLSSGPATLAYKFLAPYGTMLAAALTVYGLVLAPLLGAPVTTNVTSPAARAITCLAIGALAVYQFRFASKLKRVEMDNHNLFISDGARQIVVPLVEVREVTENRWWHAHPVTIHFRHDTAFGPRVVFLPIMTDQWVWFSRHPVVEQIEHAAGVARASA
jgi:hypothetical protein